MVEVIIYLILYLATEVINYILAYYIVFEMDVVKRKSNWIMGTVIIIVVHLIVCFLGNSTMSRSMSIFSMIIVPLCLIDGSFKKKLMLYPIILLGVGSIATSFSFILGMGLNIPEYTIVNSQIMTLICQSVSVIIMIIVAVYRKLKGYERIQLQLDTKQYVLFYIGIICTFFILGSLQVISEEGVTEVVINYYGTYTSIICIVMIVLIVWHGIVSKREVQLKEKNELYDMYMKLQEEEIKNIIENDERMRRFRHDINKHFVALNGYAKECDNKSINKYLEDMAGAIKLSEYREYTGNRAIDAVIRQLEDKAKEENINIIIRCTKIAKSNIAIFDLCTIISNLLKNAIEACEKIEDTKDRKIVFYVYEYESKLCILSKNTVKENVIVQNGKLVSGKSDKKNHGLGSGNVESAVEKYEGVFDYQCQNGWFEVEIII